mgnify:CR=1 FL=1
MKFEFNKKEPFKENIYNLMRKAGYIFLAENKESKEMNFIRPLVKGGYPRFHIYCKTTNQIENETLFFNLHLDQKRPIYQGTTAHSGDYEGEVVEEEANRVKLFFLKYA